MTDAWCAWFAGFCDGEACFYVAGMSPVFKLDLRGDDVGVLNEIQQILGVGSVRRHSRQDQRDRGIRAQDQQRLLVCGPNNLRVVEALDGRMRSKKRRDFAVWADAVRARAAGAPRAEMERFKLAIQAARSAVA